jgi:hypothetical protein
MKEFVGIKPKKIGYQTYHIKDLLKLNGFRFSRFAKTWFKQIESKASAQELLNSTNLNSSFEVVEMSAEELFFARHVANVTRKTIPMKELSGMGVSTKEVQKLIAKKKIRVSLFELDKLGRKINKQLNAYDVKNQFKELQI